MGQTLANEFDCGSRVSCEDKVELVRAGSEEAKELLANRINVGTGHAGWSVVRMRVPVQVALEVYRVRLDK